MGIKRALSTDFFAAKLLFIVSTFVLLSLQIPASQISGDTVNLVNLEEYISFAEKNNALLKSSFEQWTIAKEMLPQARALPDPQLSYGYATKATPTRKMAEVMQMFPWFGTIDARVQQAGAMSQSAGQQFQMQKLEIVYQLKAAFYDYCYLAESVRIAKENVELAKHFEQVVRSRYEVSQAPHPDIIRSQIELAKFEDDVLTVERMRTPIVARLNSLLNRPSTATLPWPQAGERKELSMDSNSILEFIVRNNPQIKMFDYEVGAAKAAQTLAQKRFYPDIGLGAAFDEGMGENGSDRYMAKVSINIPLWTKSYSALKRQAQAQTRRASQQKIQVINDLTAKARQVLYEYDDSSRKIRLYGQTIIPKNKELLAAAETAYLANTVDFLTLIDTQRLLLENQLFYQRSLFDRDTKIAELEMLAAAELKVSAMADKKNSVQQ